MYNVFKFPFWFLFILQISVVFSFLIVPEEVQDSINKLNGVCAQFHEMGHWWGYQWCHHKSIRQYQASKSLENSASIVLGIYDAVESRRQQEYVSSKSMNYFIEIYSNGDVCTGLKPPLKRQTIVHLRCCSFRSQETYIESLKEVNPCRYIMKICTPFVCPPSTKEFINGSTSSHDGSDSSKASISKERLTSTKSDKESIKHTTSFKDPKEKKTTSSHKSNMHDVITKEMSKAERRMLALEVKHMFHHAFDNYMKYAFPMDNLQPITCKGQSFELGKIRMLTLIDTLDTLVILGFYKEFRESVLLIYKHANFDVDTEVSVFEITIRVLGGLISGHLLAIEKADVLYPPNVPSYQNELLHLATDLGNRLLPAFETKTRIPYGTVNLRYGVPKGETTIASTAGAGSLSLEFAMLSVLTQDSKYAKAGKEAVRGIFRRRSSLGLVGKHIDTKTGQWTETISGLGSNSDSFYEYLLKLYIIFGDMEAWYMFQTLYTAVIEHNKHGDWYVDVSMWNGCPQRVHFENLMAFWPGMQSLVGHLEKATRTLNAFYMIWRQFDFVPEQFDVDNWSPGSHPHDHPSKRYPLRPELIESTYYLFRSTKDSTWLYAGKDFLLNLQKHSRTKCGYASISNVETLIQEDTMPSFFLSETCKYLYLLFDDNNFINDDNYVFTTEAHPFPIVSHRSDIVTQFNIIQSIEPYMKQPICRVPTFYGNLSYDIQFQHFYYPRKTRCEIGTRKQLKTRPSTKKPSSKYKTILDGGKQLGSFEAIQIIGGFLIKQIQSSKPLEKMEMRDSETSFRTMSSIEQPWIRISNLGTDYVFAETSDYWRSYYIPYKQQRNCVIQIFQSNEEKKMFPCAPAAFGPTDKMLHENISIRKARVVWALPQNGCGPLENAQLMHGNIALIQRGTCFFVNKVLNAQKAGAIGVFIVNHLDDEYPLMVMSGGMNSKLEKQIQIPSMMISKELLKALHLPSEISFFQKNQIIQRFSSLFYTKEMQFIYEIQEKCALNSFSIHSLYDIEFNYNVHRDYYNDPLVMRGTNQMISVYGSQWGVLCTKSGSKNPDSWALAILDLTSHGHTIQELMEAFDLIKVGKSP